MPESPGHIFSVKERGSNRANNFFFQPKLTINEPNDIFEQEADAVADKVMRMPDNHIAQTNFFKPSVSSLQLKCANCEEEEEEKKLKRKVNSHSDFQQQTDPFFIQRQEANETTPVPANGETETSSSSASDFLLPTPSLLQPPGTPDFLSMRQPFLNRGIPGSWNPDAALRVWNYNFNFFRGVGISPSLSTTLSNFTAPRSIDAQLRLSNPTWWEVTDRDLKTSTIGGSIPLLEFNADFSPTAPSWLKSILGGGQKGVRRKCADCANEEKMQLKEKTNESITGDIGFENYINNLDNNGQSMPTEVRNFYEPRFGYDFSNVKIHTGSAAAKSAQSINALAYTSGDNIVFNSGQYSPGTDSGKRLLGHELTHVVQQGAARTVTAVQRQAEVEVANVPGACSLPQHREIEPAVRTAGIWLNRTIGRLNDYIANPAAQAGVQASLQRHFRSSSNQTAERVRRILQRISTEMTTSRALNVECHTTADLSCSNAGAYVTGNLFVFCPTFFDGSSDWQAAAVIHEMAHSLAGITHITDRAYLSNRIYSNLSTDEALTNADSYENFSREVASGVTFSSTAPVDELNDCQDRQAIPTRRSLANIERWNRNAQTLTSDTRPGMLSQWQDLQNTHLGGTTAALIATANTAYTAVVSRMGSALTFECERSCDAGVTGYYRYFIFTSNTLHLCPMLFSLNEDPRTLEIYKLILVRYAGVDQVRASALAQLAQAVNARFWGPPGALAGFD
jgi:hypothetical protein